MDFNTLDKLMRSFEQSLDRTMMQGIYIVARLDGHGFTRLTKQEWDLEKPFDIRFHEAMLATLRQLMESDFRVVYGYTQSDEISLLFHIDDQIFGRKERKFLSILASQASVAFSTAAGRCGVFDCRLVPLPSKEYVLDYFRWRQEDCHRNSLNSHCYWLLRKQGMSASDAQRTMAKMTVATKNELLFSNGINYNNLPLWQRRGVGMYFSQFEHHGFNPVTNEPTSCIRRKLELNEQLPIGPQYAEMIADILG